MKFFPGQTVYVIANKTLSLEEPDEPHVFGQVVDGCYLILTRRTVRAVEEVESKFCKRNVETGDLESLPSHFEFDFEPAPGLPDQSGHWGPAVYADEAEAIEAVRLSRTMSVRQQTAYVAKAQKLLDALRAAEQSPIYDEDIGS